MGPGSTGHGIGAYQTNLWWPFLYLKSDSPLFFGTLMQNWICLLWWATSLQQGLQTIHEESALELQIKDGRKLTHNHNGLTKTWEHPWVSQKTNALPSLRGSNYTIGQSHKSLKTFMRKLNRYTSSLDRKQPQWASLTIPWEHPWVSHNYKSPERKQPYCFILLGAWVHPA